MWTSDFSKNGRSQSTGIKRAKRAIHLASAMFSPRRTSPLFPRPSFDRPLHAKGGGREKTREESSFPSLLQRKIPVLIARQSIYKPLINRRLEETITLTATNDSHSFGSWNLALIAPRILRINFEFDFRLLYVHHVSADFFCLISNSLN